MIFENIRIAMIGLQSNRLRSVLTMLGIIIGVSAVVILLSVGQAFERFVVGEFTDIGTNLMFVFAGGGNDPFTEEEYLALTNGIYTPDVLYVMPQVNSNQTAVYAGRDMDVEVSGVTPVYTEIQTRGVEIGRMFTDEEVEANARVALIGQEVAERLYAEVDLPVGETIRLGNASFQVIGVLEEGEDGGPLSGNDIVLVPYTTAQTRLVGGQSRNNSGDRTIHFFTIRAVDSDAVDAAFEQVRTALRATRDLADDDEDNFRVLNQADLVESLTTIIGLLTIFLGVIAGISLLVGGIGVMNIMLVTVTERTREIGLRKAVGAQRTDIIVQFLVEAIVITVVGGIIGIVFAYGIAEVVSAFVASLLVSINPASIILALGISAGIGIFFGIYPAQRAARMKPIDALRYE